MQSRCTSVRWLFFQHALNCCTQGSVSRPCRIHLSSAGVSLKLIFNMLFPSGLVSEKSLCDRKNDCVDIDRKSTRLNSSHLGISYAVFCLKKKRNVQPQGPITIQTCLRQTKV